MSDSTEKLGLSQRIVLHVGCGPSNPLKLHEVFRTKEWREVRLDLDPNCQPDLVASITDMQIVDSESVDAVWSSHNLEHLESHDVPLALAEFIRVLKPGAFLLVTLPDLQKVAELIANDQLEEEAYRSAAGPITPLDMVFGHRRSIARGNKYMAHRTGFTAKTLINHLKRAGFVNTIAKRVRFDLWARAEKPALP